MIKNLLIGLGIILIIILIVIGLFLYKVSYGFPFYDDDTQLEITIDPNEFAVLVFSKTNGFRHGSAIDASNAFLKDLGEKNNWRFVFTENGGMLNSEVLKDFNLVIWNNVTGRVLTDGQRNSFKSYILGGGGYLGIHGAGDFSHHWPWYEENLVGASFSHHTMQPQIQDGRMNRQCSISLWECLDLPESFIMIDEWYTFHDNPRDRGFDVLYSLDESSIVPSGNIPFLVSDKDWGMGADHPIVWKKCVGEGRAVYSALGHDKNSWNNNNHRKVIGAVIGWAGGLTGTCN